MNRLPFQIDSLFKSIAATFPPGQVKLVGEVIDILNGKIKVTVEGVEGTGSTADHVRKVYNKFYNLTPESTEGSPQKPRQASPVQCPHCQKMLKSSGGLTNHLRKDHLEAFLQLID